MLICLGDFPVPHPQEIHKLPCRAHHQVFMDPTKSSWSSPVISVQASLPSSPWYDRSSGIWFVREGGQACNLTTIFFKASLCDGFQPSMHPFSKLQTSTLIAKETLIVTILETALDRRRDSLSSEHCKSDSELKQPMTGCAILDIDGCRVLRDHLQPPDELCPTLTWARFGTIIAFMPRIASYGPREHSNRKSLDCLCVRSGTAVVLRHLSAETQSNAPT
ncbi:hypothetical protein ARMGADRAFT_570129 [Armillaria gallica]|uniref:Uncharacterized protein n=1 Tax=Armillaria gallica TaxID=47427 RepID=A0A2H3DVV9_ARMGA|nr:hypothetical protein ARMGADRAFT_570129 [Armillaria gallica]